MKLKDILSPFYVWKRAFEKPYSIATLTEQRPGAERYRGFHKNDMNKCIGCGSCAEICQNVTIDMVQAKEAKDGDSGLRPRFDYGLCCWCALCVDICPTGSLSMSNAYTWVEEGLDKDVRETFCFVPGVDAKPWDNEQAGYKKPDNYELLHLDRIPMPHMPTEESLHTFIEMVKGYSAEMAQKEADRCIQCGICTATCPAHMNIPAYIKAIREHDIEEGLRIMYETNPLPGVCGRVCTRRCEDVCALSHRGEAISIRWLKRYLSDSVSADRYAHVLDSEITQQNKSVAIIGAGAGGLSAAYYLLKMGYNVEIFEAKGAAGGMLRYGIPEYRLPYDALDKDINYIVNLGAKLHLNTKIGKDITFDDIYNKFSSVFISVGLFAANRLAIEGENLPGVLNGLDFLDDITLGKKPEIGKKVLVIGGGNVAMDAARTARRLGAEVAVIYRRREIDMPADREEIEEAYQEGIEFFFQAIPIKIEKTNDNKLNFVWGKAEMVEQPDGKRPIPVMIEGSREVTSGDTVISAVGQSAGYEWMDGKAITNITFGKYNIKADRWGKTSDNRVFIGGDIFNSVADAISAIADGHRSARAIDAYLQTK